MALCMIVGRPPSVTANPAADKEQYSGRPAPNCATNGVRIPVSNLPRRGREKSRELEHVAW